jgi:hypothetical protein
LWGVVEATKEVRSFIVVLYRGQHDRKESFPGFQTRKWFDQGL